MSSQFYVPPLTQIDSPRTRLSSVESPRFRSSYSPRASPSPQQTRDQLRHRVKDLNLKLASRTQDLERCRNENLSLEKKYRHLALQLAQADTAQQPIVARLRKENADLKKEKDALSGLLKHSKIETEKAKHNLKILQKQSAPDRDMMSLVSRLKQNAKEYRSQKNALHKSNRQLKFSEDRLKKKLRKVRKKLANINLSSAHPQEEDDRLARMTFQNTEEMVEYLVDQLNDMSDKYINAKTQIGTLTDALQSMEEQGGDESTKSSLMSQQIATIHELRDTIESANKFITNCVINFGLDEDETEDDSSEDMFPDLAQRIDFLVSALQTQDVEQLRLDLESSRGKMEEMRTEMKDYEDGLSQMELLICHNEDEECEDLNVALRMEKVSNAIEMSLRKIQMQEEAQNSNQSESTELLLEIEALRDELTVTRARTTEALQLKDEEIMTITSKFNDLQYEHHICEEEKEKAIKSERTKHSQKLKLVTTKLSELQVEYGNMIDQFTKLREADKKRQEEETPEKLLQKAIEKYQETGSNKVSDEFKSIVGQLMNIAEISPQIKKDDGEQSDSEEGGTVEVETIRYATLAEKSPFSEYELDRRTTITSIRTYETNSVVDGKEQDEIESSVSLFPDLSISDFLIQSHFDYSSDEDKKTADEDTESIKTPRIVLPPKEKVDLENNPFGETKLSWEQPFNAYISTPDQREAVANFFEKYSQASNWKGKRDVINRCDTHKLQFYNLSPIHVRMSFLYPMTLYLGQAVGVRKRSISYAVILMRSSRKQIAAICDMFSMILETLDYHGDEKLWKYVFNFLFNANVYYKFIHSFVGKRTDTRRTNAIDILSERNDGYDSDDTFEASLGSAPTPRARSVSPGRAGRRSRTRPASPFSRPSRADRPNRKVQELTTLRGRNKLRYPAPTKKDSDSFSGDKMSLPNRGGNLFSSPSRRYFKNW